MDSSPLNPFDWCDEQSNEFLHSNKEINNIHSIDALSPNSDLMIDVKCSRTLFNPEFVPSNLESCFNHTNDNLLSMDYLNGFNDFQFGSGKNFQKQIKTECSTNNSPTTNNSELGLDNLSPSTISSSYSAFGPIQNVPSPEPLFNQSEENSSIMFVTDKYPEIDTSMVMDNQQNNDNLINHLHTINNAQSNVDYSSMDYNHNIMNNKQNFFHSNFQYQNQPIVSRTSCDRSNILNGMSRKPYQSQSLSCLPVYQNNELYDNRDQLKYSTSNNNLFLSSTLMPMLNNRNSFQQNNLPHSTSTLVKDTNFCSINLVESNDEQLFANNQFKNNNEAGKRRRGRPSRLDNSVVKTKVTRNIPKTNLNLQKRGRGRPRSMEFNRKQSKMTIIDKTSNYKNHYSVLHNYSNSTSPLVQEETFSNPKIKFNNESFYSRNNLNIINNDLITKETSLHLKSDKLNDDDINEDDSFLESPNDYSLRSDYSEERLSSFLRTTTDPMLSNSCIENNNLNYNDNNSKTFHFDEPNELNPDEETFLNDNLKNHQERNHQSNNNFVSSHRVSSFFHQDLLNSGEYLSDFEALSLNEPIYFDDNIAENDIFNVNEYHQTSELQEQEQFYFKLSSEMPIESNSDTIFQLELANSRGNLEALGLNANEHFEDNIVENNIFENVNKYHQTGQLSKTNSSDINFLSKMPNKSNKFEAIFHQKINSNDKIRTNKTLALNANQRINLNNNTKNGKIEEFLRDYQFPNLDPNCVERILND